ncbi:hypothetical protein PR048_003624 [Dryococelus australis]|uniref:Uncharacterized protein n=1 Tax=Dryococelus australis TaxID=614101 RepID=A0ABQ9INP7_9NEOP|nr:hypothetical protein PR048_003624 [Dryococelus australis]
MPLVGGFSPGSLVSPPLHSGAAPNSPHFTLIGSYDLDRDSRGLLLTLLGLHATPADNLAASQPCPATLRDNLVKHPLRLPHSLKINASFGTCRFLDSQQRVGTVEESAVGALPAMEEMQPARPRPVPPYRSSDRTCRRRQAFQLLQARGTMCCHRRVAPCIVARARPPPHTTHDSQRPTGRVSQAGLGLWAEAGGLARVGCGQGESTLAGCLHRPPKKVSPGTCSTNACPFHHSLKVRFSQLRKLHELRNLHKHRRLDYSPPTKSIRVHSSTGLFRIFACGNRAGRYRWSTDFLGDLPIPPPLIGSQDLAELCNAAADQRSAFYSTDKLCIALRKFAGSKVTIAVDLRLEWSECRERNKAMACLVPCHKEEYAYIIGAAVVQLRDNSPPTKANRVRFPVGSPPDFCMWEPWRTMPLAGGFFRGSPISPALVFRRCSTLALLHTHLFSRPLCGAAQIIAQESSVVHPQCLLV